MKALITTRRILPGREQEFRRLWAGDPTPDGMTDAYLLQDDQDSRQTLSFSLWKDGASLSAYRRDRERQGREQELAPLVEGESSRLYDVTTAAALKGGRGGSKAKLLAPAALGLAGGAWYAATKLRRPEPTIVEKSKRGPWPLALGLALPLLGVGAFLLKKMRGKSEERRWQEAEAAPLRVTPRSATTTNRAGSSAAAPNWSGAGGSSATSLSGGPGAGTTRERMDRAYSGSVMPRVAGMRVRDLMTRNPETVEHDDELARAAAKMHDLNVGVLPVMADGNLTGIVTDRDLTRAMAEGDHAPEKRLVRDVMTEAPMTVRPDATVEEAAHMMAERQIRRLPVVEGTDLVGIISLGDLAADGADEAAGAALEQISEPARPQR